ncbi:MAG: ATP/GTP-binding protein [Acidobacteriota bacterium]
MIEYTPSENKIVVKLVYFGPALSGKTTNLLTLHDLLDQRGRGNLMILDTKDDRTIFFDLLPFYFVAPSGVRIKVKVYTVPGHVHHNATRKAVLAGADGIAFIADSQRTEAINNRESFRNLEENLAFLGMDIEQVPLVIQFNKRDLEAIVTEEEIRKTWHGTDIPIFKASALNGWGVLETLRSLLELTYDYIDGECGLHERYKLLKRNFVDNLVPLQPAAAGK